MSLPRYVSRDSDPRPQNAEGTMGIPLARAVIAVRYTVVKRAAWRVEVVCAADWAGVSQMSGPF